MFERAPAQVAERPASVVEGPVVQAKLEVGRVDDPAEREADRVAEQVLQRLGELQRAPASIASASSNRVRRSAALPVPVAPPGVGGGRSDGLPASRIRRSALASRAPIGPQGGEIDGETSGRIRRATNGGAPLDATTQQRMGDAFGADFSSVRIHEGSSSAELNRSLGARAFTTGSHVFLGADSPAIGSREGDRLLAHELTHTIQQGGASVARAALPAGRVRRAPGAMIRRDGT